MRILEKFLSIASYSFRALLLTVPTLLLSACDTEPSGGQLIVGEAGNGKLSIDKPGFLVSRVFEASQVEAQVSVTVDSVTYPALKSASNSTDTQWQGTVYVPDGSDGTLIVEWFETNAIDLPDEENGRLKLSSYTLELSNINTNRTISIDSSDYVVGPSEDDSRPDLDLDEDGYGNLLERLEGSQPDNAEDGPPEVTILYNKNASVIAFDGVYESIWNTAQFKDVERNDLFINKVLQDNGVIQPGEDRGYKWGAMHDGSYLYIVVSAEKGSQQTPFSDSDRIYDDDTVDIFLDGNASRGVSYDGSDDFHALISLISSEEGGNSPNQSNSEYTRFSLGERSSPIDPSAFEFFTCLCRGQQQFYEMRISLEQANITVGKTFGIDVQLNNDVDGNERDAKWAWHNNTGVDDSWLYPIRMGIARLDPVTDG